MRLADVRGHERARGVLARALGRDRLPPALLFAGPDGVGKKTLALAVAQAVLCERAPAAEACGACRTCRKLDSSLDPARLDAMRREADEHPDEDVFRNHRVHPDLVLAEGWWLTRTGRPRSEPEIRVDQVRDLIGEIAGAPFEARRRVFVIDDAHTMNDSAQNALLKSLEEPAPRSHVILVSASPMGLRQTIRSRCQTVRFGPLPRRVAADLAAARGGEDEGLDGLREQILSLLERAEGMSAAERLASAEALEQAEDPVAVLTLLRALLRDLAALRAGAPESALLHPGVAERLRPVASGGLGARAAHLAAVAAETRFALRGFASKLLTFDVLVDELAGGDPAP